MCVQICTYILSTCACITWQLCLYTCMHVYVCLRMKIYMHMAVHTLVRGRYTAGFILHEPDTQKEESLPCDTLEQALPFFRSCPSTAMRPGLQVEAGCS